jgi:Mg2+ and Co2+ transporter CorA
MLSYYKTVDGRMTQIEACEPGCWINCVAPDDREIESLIEDFGIEPDFFAPQWTKKNPPILIMKATTHWL